MENLKNMEVVPKSVIEKIKELYRVELIEISYDDLPIEVKKHFESQSGKFILPEAYKERNFTKLYMFTHPNGDVTYIGQQDKEYDTNKETERLTYFADIRGEEMIGYLEMRLALTNLSQYFKGKPFVGFTRTKEGYFGEGLALRRLEEANAYALAEHGLPLNSDSLVTDEARGVWSKLISEGKVEDYDEKGKIRYRFIKLAQ